MKSQKGLPCLFPLQPWMQDAADLFEAIGIFSGYDPLLMPDCVASALLNLNAAPSTLEMFAVLKNQGRNVRFVSEPAEYISLWRSAQAVFRFRKSSLLLIGDYTRELAICADMLGLEFAG